MKKKLFLILTFISTIFLTTISCSFSKSGDSDRKISNTHLEKLLNAISKKDKETIKQMFSPEIIKKCDSFDESVDLLFNYFLGDFVSYDDMDAYVCDDDFERDGTRRKKISSTYIVKTSKTEYRIAIFDCIIDTRNQNNVGIKSLYIVKESESSSYGFAYWGDGNETPGINIGISDTAQPIDDKEN